MVIYFVILVYVVGDDYKILYKYILSGAILSEWNPAGMIIQPVSRGSSDLAIWFCLEITPKLMLYHPLSSIFINFLHVPIQVAIWVLYYSEFGQTHP